MIHLLAVVGELDRNALIVFAIGVLLLLLLFVVVWMILRQISRGMEYAHLEKMKEIELGRPPRPAPGEEGEPGFGHQVFWIAFWLGAGVPCFGLGSAAFVMIQPEPVSYSIQLVIWICVGCISIASVICATVLMLGSRKVCSKRHKKHIEDSTSAQAAPQA